MPVGTHAIAYRATDAAMNVEETKTAQIVVLDPAGDGTALTLAANRTGLSLLSGLASARPDDIRFEFSAPPGPVPLYASVEVFRGIRAWPQLGGLPATPMRPGELSITVSGEAVDHYRWRLNGGAWSAEAPVSEPIALNCTTAGGYTLDVVARSAHGGYPPDADAVRASWAVADDAPGVVLLEAPTHPHTAKTAPFRVSGTDITNYRWSLNANYIRPSAPVSQPFAVSNLTDGAYEVRIFPNLPNGEHTEEGYAAYHWTNRLAYGYDCTGLSCVRTRNAARCWHDSSGTDATMPGAGLPGWYGAGQRQQCAGQVIWAKACRRRGTGRKRQRGRRRQPRRATHARTRRLGVWTDRSGEQWQIWRATLRPTARRSR